MNSKKVLKRLTRIETLLKKLLDQSSGKATRSAVEAAPAKAAADAKKKARPVAKKRKRAAAKRPAAVVAASEPAPAVPLEDLNVEEMTDVPVAAAAGFEGESNG